MHQFEVSDRVRITNPNLIHFGKTGVIAAYCEIMCESAWLVRVDGTDDSCQYKDASLTHTPDVITINRADLPDVEVNEAGWVKSANNYLAHVDSADPTTLRSIALQYLSAAEFLEAREKAAEEDAAAEKLNKRRDELAKEVAKRACYVNYQNYTYEDHVPAAQAAINMFIELEDPRG